MRQKGKIRAWNDGKGFGFIETSTGGKDVFLHISAFGNRNRRPEVGQLVTYMLSRDAQGRPRASKATLPGDGLSKSGGWSGKVGAFFVAISFLALVAISVFVSMVPALVLWVYLAVSLITYLVYAFDKRAAKDGAWRTKEGTLHWLSLLGGWPGALVAQHTLRHKSKKKSFRLVFWLTVPLNLAAFIWMLAPTGGGVIKSWIDGELQRTGLGQETTIEWAEPREH